MDTLNILLKYNKDLYKEMLKLVKKVTKRMGVKTNELNPFADMVEIWQQNREKNRVE